MERYFVKFRNGVQCKNAAQKEVYELLRQQDGLLISTTKARDGFIEELKTHIKRINYHHRRCADIEVSTWEINGHLNLSASGGCGYLSFFKVKMELE